MAISKVMKNTSLLWGGVLLFFISCSPTHSNDQILITQSDRIGNFKTIDDDTRIFVFGAHYITLDGDIKFLSSLSSQDTLCIYNIKHGELVQQIKLAQNAFGITAKDSSLYVFYENGLHYQKITFSDSILATYRIDSLGTLPLFNDSLFVSSFANTPIHILNASNFLLPYRKQNQTHNYTDTFSYMLVDCTKPYDALKLAKYPALCQDDYLFKAISTYDFNKHRFIYTFQKSNTIHLADIQTKTEETFQIDALEAIDFPKNKLRDISFTRRYLKQNDKVAKILVDSLSNIFIVVKFAEKNKNRFRIYFYHDKSKKLFYKDTPLNLYSDMAFIKNNNLLIPNENNRYSIFSIRSSLLQAK